MKTKKALIAEAKFIVAKAEAEGREFTAEESARAAEIKAEVEALDEKAQKNADARNSIKGAFGDDSSDGSDGTQTKAVLGSGEPSPAAKALTHAITEQYGNTKAVTVTAGTVSVAANLGVVPMGRNANLLQNIVQVIPQENGAAGTLADGSDSLTFLRQTARTNAAAPVARGAQKPESAFTFERANQGFVTLAHVVTVPNQFLQDSAQFGQVLQDELLYGLALAMDDLLLTDSVDEDGGTVNGLLTMTGIGATAFATDALLTIRRGITSLQKQGYQPTHVALGPDDWEAIETLRKTDESFLLPGLPTGSADLRLWNLPVALTPELNGQAVVGDFSTRSIGLASRGPITLQHNPYTRDVHNETIIRCEGRFSPAVTRPAAFTVADLTAAI